MIHEQKSPQSLVRALADQEIAPEPQEVLVARRERAVGIIAWAIRQNVIEQERRAGRRRWFWTLGIAAGVAFSVFGVHRAVRAPVLVDDGRSSGVATVESVRGTLIIAHASRSRVVRADEHPDLFGGDELQTGADGWASLRTGRSAIQVTPATQLTVLTPSPAEERIRLILGQVDLQVHRQVKAPRTVVVETPHSEVIVRGTRFSVAVETKDARTGTRVRVQQGSVWVLAGGARHLLSAGEEWSSLERDSVGDSFAQSKDAQSKDAQSKDAQSKDAQSKDAQSKDAQSKDAQSKDAQSKDAQSKDAQSKDAQSKDAQSKDAQSKDAQSRELRAERRETGHRSMPSRITKNVDAVSSRVFAKGAGSGALAEENRLFEAAVQARNQEDDRRVVDILGTQLARYPKGKLSEEARVERLRALRRLGETMRAAVEARRYLAEHGTGFAREEARDAALGLE